MTLSMTIKPYQSVPIADCGDRLVAILDPPGDHPSAAQPGEDAPIAVIDPHPYVALGAPYGDRSPFWLRRAVRDRLWQAAAELQRRRPGWQIQIFDAYRPVAVQAFMVDYTWASLARAAGFEPSAIDPASQLAQHLRQQVALFWASPSPNPATPPPHSTGAALDVTLLDGSGEPVDMGSPIDECSPRSFPDYFAMGEGAGEPLAAVWDDRRRLLAEVMAHAEFVRHPNEWWHFSWGDQLWAWTTGQAQAHYGRI